MLLVNEGTLMYLLGAGVFEISLTSDILTSSDSSSSALRDQCEHIEAYLGSLLSAQGTSSLANIANRRYEIQEVEWTLDFLGIP